MKRRKKIIKIAWTIMSVIIIISMIIFTFGATFF